MPSVQIVKKLQVIPNTLSLLDWFVREMKKPSCQIFIKTGDTRLIKKFIGRCIPIVTAPIAGLTPAIDKMIKKSPGQKLFSPYSAF
jgi:hypothetical protein